MEEGKVNKMFTRFKKHFRVYSASIPFNSILDRYRPDRIPLGR